MKQATNFITEETRRESYIKTDKSTLRMEILQTLRESSRPLTAREVAEILYNKRIVAYPLRQEVQPRLTELCEDGRVEVIGKLYDEKTQRKVAVYKAYGVA